jgi:hypothetical protein
VTNLSNSPLLVLALSLLIMWASGWTSPRFAGEGRTQEDTEHEYVGVVEGAALAPLALIYRLQPFHGCRPIRSAQELRGAEANAIGTEYVRADPLRTADVSRVGQLLKSYLDQHLLFYTTRDPGKPEQVEAVTGGLQRDLWPAAQASAAAQPTSVAGLAVSRMTSRFCPLRGTSADSKMTFSAELRILTLDISNCSIIQRMPVCQRQSGRSLKRFEDQKSSSDALTVSPGHHSTITISSKSATVIPAALRKRRSCSILRAAVFRLGQRAPRKPSRSAQL